MLNQENFAEDNDFGGQTRKTTKRRQGSQTAQAGKDREGEVVDSDEGKGSWQAMTRGPAPPRVSLDSLTIPVRTPGMRTDVSRAANWCVSQ
jgi:hypothetical protein